MKNFISEDDIEQAILAKLKEEPFKYDIIICDSNPDKRDDLNDGTGRTTKKQCVLPVVFEKSLQRINPNVELSYLQRIAKDLSRDFTGTDMVQTNYKLYQQIRNGIKIDVKRNGKPDFDIVKLVDFDNPENNTFTAVSQMWIQGKVYYRRPDVLVFINGLPMVFIELKNSIVKVEEAYNKNLTDYRNDIPNLFAFNQICVLSNGLKTKLGAFNATYDYFFEWLKVKSEKEELHRDELLQALTEYATGDDGKEFPAKNIDQLVIYIDETIDETDQFLNRIGIYLSKIVADSSTFDKLDKLRSALDTIVAVDDNKEQFKVRLNLLMNLYDASKPEIFERHWSNDMFPPLAYLYGLMCHTIDDEKVNRARIRMSQLLDTSVTSAVATDDPNGQYAIHGTKVIDLSKIDVEEIRKEIKTAEYKAIEIDDLKAFIDEALERMINKNCTRTAFSQRYKSIIDRYNAGGSENEDYYEQLIELIEQMKKEESRAEAEGLTEEELEMYDLLVAGKKLTKDEEQRVKLAAKNLFKKLTENRKSLLVVDWYKDEMPREKVEDAIRTSLDEDLPESYDKESFQSKITLLLNHFIDMAIQGYGWISAA